MPNSYTAVPNILPGNVTIGGNLTVQGSTIKLGAGPRFTRLQDNLGREWDLSHNQDVVNGVVDDGGFGTIRTRGLEDVGDGRLEHLVGSGVPALTLGFRWIAGELDVGADLIRIGAASPFVRVLKDVSLRLALSRNLGPDFITRDDAAASALMLFTTVGPEQLALRYVNAAGVSTDDILAQIFALNYTGATVTGVTTETTVFSKVIGANTLGAFGGFVINWVVSASAQGATATTLRIKLGATVIEFLTHAAVEEIQMRMVLANLGLTNSQYHYMLGFRSSVTSVSIGAATTAVDTTVDQTLSCTIQPGATTDNHRSRGVEVYGFSGAAAAI